MKVSGIITEYNPFHNGHAYQINKARDAGSDMIIVIMSGDFTQRGEPAIIDKYSRVKMALNNGADLVIELPVMYATADAGRFAMGGVSILNSLGVVDELVFGIEEGVSEYLQQLTNFLAAPPEEYDKQFKAELKKGASYPVARVRALQSCMKINPELLSGSNTILALEYCQALKQLKSNIIPHPISRLGNNYNDTDIKVTGYSSASAIRKLLSADKIDNNTLKMAVPDNCIDFYHSANLIMPNDISGLLHYKLLCCDDYTKYLDVTKSFSDRLISLRDEYTEYASFCQLIKSKNITHTSVQRLLAHILLDIKMDVPEKVPYARILGFKKESSALLSEIKNSSQIPMITKMADASYILNDSAMEMLNTDIIASNIYESIVTNKYSVKGPNEFTRGVIIV